MAAGKQVEARALELLAAPDFFHRLLGALRRLGLVGESVNGIVLYLVAVSALLTRPLNAFVKGRSATGNNFLGSRVLELIPSSAVVEITRSSTTAWSYARESFRHKVVYLQERNDSAGAVHPVRTLISEGKLIRTVTVRENGMWIPKRFVAEGPISSISTTTRDRLEVDDETRHLSLWIDETPEQTRKINKAYISEPAPMTQDDIAVWHQAHRIIAGRAETPVTIPDWFTIVAEGAYADDVTSRRYFLAFVEVCKTISLLQSFRSQDAFKGRQIKLTLADYAVASLLFEDIFVESLHRNSDDTLGTHDAVEALSRSRDGAAIDALSLAEYLSISAGGAYQLLRNALEAKLIRRANGPNRGNSKLFLPATLPRFVPDPQDVLMDVPEILDPVEFVHPLTGKLVQLRRAKRGKEMK